MKYNSIEGIDRWYKNGMDWEEWDIVMDRARREWKEEMKSAYEDGVRSGIGNRPQLMENLHKVIDNLKGEIQIPMSSEDWFKNNRV
jgi:hypothetical protein